MPIRSRSAVAIVLSLLVLLLNFRDVQAMSPGQLQLLAGTTLLDLRTDKLFQDCGLPAGIADRAEVSQPRQTLHRDGVEMKLSAMDWEMIYSPRREPGHHENGWLNPGAGSVACLSGLARLVLHAKGDVGILTVKKRVDNKG